MIIYRFYIPQFIHGERLETWTNNLGKTIECKTHWIIFGLK